MSSTAFTAAQDIAAYTPAALKQKILQRTEYVATLGHWPVWIDRETSLAARVPDENGAAAGFDAGIACALGLIPAAAETLCATLHAAYTPAAVAAVRGAIAQDETGSWRIRDPDSAACWWLAACSLCTEGDVVTGEDFRVQLVNFGALQNDADLRRVAAEKTLNDMCRAFDTQRGYAFGDKDGCMQGAYIAGHDVAVMQAAHHDVYFVGTFHPSLGLEDFDWGTAIDDKGRAKSGPVHGSRQFVKCADESELARAIKAVRLPAPAAKAQHPAP
ncbi:MAG: hypothetical protein Q8K65_02400 [Alphaproteobacteria bacterium]|nr:hypothetical protein [Alphaproteobacteria bacterium]